MAALKPAPVLHYSVFYIFWSFVIIEPILGLSMRITDEVELIETGYSGPESLTPGVFNFVSVFIADWG